jgi:hypothetical protein
MNNSYPFQVRLDRVVTDPLTSELVKRTARKLMSNPYLTLGQFFEGLSDHELTELSFSVELAMDGDDDEGVDIMLLSEMLARAEGCEPQCFHESHENMNFFITLITLAILARKGFVELFYDKLTFGHDVDDTIVKIREDRRGEWDPSWDPEE